MFQIYRDPATLDLIIRTIDRELDKTTLTPGSIAEEIRELIITFLVKEYIAKHGDHIINAIHADDIAYKMTDSIVTFIRQLLTTQVIVAKESK